MKSSGVHQLAADPVTKISDVYQRLAHVVKTNNVARPWSTELKKINGVRQLAAESATKNKPRDADPKVSATRMHGTGGLLLE